MVAVGLLVSRNIMSLGIIQFLLRENQKLVRIYMNEHNKRPLLKRLPRRHHRNGNIVVRLGVSLSLSLFSVAIYLYSTYMYNVHVTHINCSCCELIRLDICNKVVGCVILFAWVVRSAPNSRTWSFNGILEFLSFAR